MQGKHFNGLLVFEFMQKHPELKRVFNETVFKGHNQVVSYFKDKVTCSSETLWLIHSVTGIPLENLYIGEGEKQPDLDNINQSIVFHHNRIHTVNANTSPEVLRALLDSSERLLNEKEKEITRLNKMYDEILRRFPRIENEENK